MPFAKDLETLLAKYYQRKAAIANWVGVTAVQALEDSQDELQKNRNAESEWTRRTLWGKEDAGKSMSDDEMRQTILGDINHPAPIIMQPPAANNWLAPILAAALAGGGGYWLATKDKPAPPPTAQIEFTDETVSVGLGRLEDYEGVK